MNLENPLLISLLIYVPLCLVLYYTKPKFLFDDDNSDDDNSGNNTKTTKTTNIFKRNRNMLFILIPFLLYGVVSIFISNRIKNNYCKYLKRKELSIKDLLEKCKK
jgi:hypothetical protein